MMQEQMDQNHIIPYLAGFFDGEGCISIGNNGSLALGVVNTSKPVLDLFVEVLGGVVQPRKQRVNKPQYVWRIYGKDAIRVLLILAPYIVDKKPQLDSALMFMEKRDTFPPIRTGTRGGKANPLRMLLVNEYQTTLTQQKLGTYDR